MSFFVRNKGKIFVLIIVSVLMFVIGKTVVRTGKVSKVEGLVGDFLSPGSKVVSSVASNLSGKMNSVKSYFSLEEENEKLRARIAELEQENLALEKTIASSPYLKKEYDLENKTSYKLVKANIIGLNSTNWFNVFTIDKGEKDGVTENQTVVAAIQTDTGFVKEGLVGKVIEVGGTWAKVESIIDEQNSMAFISTRTLDGGVLTGNKSDELEGYMFDRKSAPNIGERIITSGLGGLYVPDIYIGTVIEAKMSEDNLVRKVRVEPSVNFKQLHRVYIITGVENE